MEPEYTHSLASDFRFFDQFDFTNLFLYVRTSCTSDAIVQSRTVDVAGFQQSSPVNTDRSWSASAGVNYGMPIRALGAKTDLAYSFNHSRGSEFVNDAENESRVTLHTVSAGIDNRYKDLFDVRMGGSITHNNVDSSLNDQFDRSYINGTFFASGAWYYREAWTFASSLNYRGFDQDVFGSSENVAFLDASISRLLMNDRAEIQLVGFDRLDRNQGVTFTNSPNFIQETRVESLGRRLMLKFTWRLGRIGGGLRGIRR